MDSESLAKAIELILLALFVPGEQPTSDDESMQIAHAIAARAVAATGSGCAMRVFQKAGVSSLVVARALRTGVLRAVEVDS